MPQGRTQGVLSGVRGPRSSSIADTVRSLQGLVGEVSGVVDHTWEHGESDVVEAVTDRAGRVFVKKHHKRRNFQAELAAYREVVPLLGQGAPSLVATDESRCILIISALEGERVDRLSDDEEYLDSHRLAGALARRLHSSLPAVPAPDWLVAQRLRVEQWIGRPGATAAIERRDRVLIDSLLERIHLDEPPELVFAHRDWRPRNWLWKRGEVFAIDFEHARYDSWLADVAVSHFGEWFERPELGDAFFEGYGSRPAGADLDLLCVSALSAVVVTLVWASQDGAVELANEARQTLDNLHAYLNG